MYLNQNKTLGSICKGKLENYKLYVIHILRT